MKLRNFWEMIFLKNRLMLKLCEVAGFLFELTIAGPPYDETFYSVKLAYGQ